MRVLVYPHQLQMGGSQLNAIELAAQLQRDGHDVAVFGHEGPLVERMTELGVEFVPSPRPHQRPDLRIADTLRRLVRRRRIDVIHAWEWPPILEAALASRGTPAATLGTVMSMSVAPHIPKGIPLTVGTRQLREAELRFGRRMVGLLEPPVDAVANNPVSDFGQREFRARFGVQDDEILIVTVSRLARVLKLEGLLTAAAVVGELAARHPVKLVLVGGGEARDEVQQAADAANAVARREAVVLAGELADPRAAYAAANLALGMGGSALRSLAFGTPLIVQGERGYWRLADEESADEFRWQGWYGVGGDAAGGHAALHEILEPLVASADRRSSLRDASLALARHYSLTSTARRLAALYEDARDYSAAHNPLDIPEALRCGAALVKRIVAGEIGQRFGAPTALDDFNSVHATASVRAVAGPQGAR